jgi:hypothetical protein
MCTIEVSANAFCNTIRRELHMASNGTRSNSIFGHPQRLLVIGLLAECINGIKAPASRLSCESHCDGAVAFRFISRPPSVIWTGVGTSTQATQYEALHINIIQDLTTGPDKYLPSVTSEV